MPCFTGIDKKVAFTILSTWAAEKAEVDKYFLKILGLSQGVFVCI